MRRKGLLCAVTAAAVSGGANPEIARGSNAVSAADAESWQQIEEALNPLRKPGLVSPLVIHAGYERLSMTRKFDSKLKEVAYTSFEKHFPAPQFRHVFLVDGECRACLAKHFPRFVPPPRNANNQPVYSCRFCALFALGGVYADLDVEANSAFWAELPKHIVSVPESPYEEDDGYSGFLLASPPFAGFWREVFGELQKQAMAEDESLLGKKMPHFEPRACIKAISRVMSKSGSDVHPLPCGLFFRPLPPMEDNGRCADIRDDPDLQRVFRWTPREKPPGTHPDEVRDKKEQTLIEGIFRDIHAELSSREL